MAFAGATIDHDRIAHNLYTALDQLFPEPCRAFGAEVKVRVAPDTLYYADGGVMYDNAPGDATMIERPRIVSEVLSQSTLAYDLVEKRSAYRGLASLSAYIIIHTALRRIEVDERWQDGSWRTETYDVGEAFVNGRAIALDAIYARSSLADR